MAPSSETAQLAVDYMQAWGSADPARLASWFADDGTYTDAIVAWQPLPPPALIDYAKVLYAAVPDVSFRIEESLAMGPDAATVRWVMGGHHKGPLLLPPAGPSGPIGPLEPTGNEFALPGVEVVHFRDGRIVQAFAYFDLKSYLEQAGYGVAVATAQG